MSLLMYVAAWIAIGFFTAWIGTRIETPGRPGVIANVPVAVLGALLGGVVPRALLAGPNRYGVFLVSVIAAQVTAAVFVAFADVMHHRHPTAHVR
jgi:uncharacterized membrane protein YeaQ/YmgE (transglycosylase-associated protein family)